MRQLAVIALVTILAACSDPTGPCSGRYACQVSGVDIAVVEARLVEGTRIGSDPITGLPVYAPGPLRIEFTVVNRGDSTSLPQPLSNGDTAPALAPGETYMTYTEHDFTGVMALMPSWRDPVEPRQADRFALFAGAAQGGSPSEPPFDADPDNNGLLHEFHLAVPVLQGTASPIGQIRQNEPFTLSFSIENRSVRGADAPALDVALCLWMVHYGCTEGFWMPFGRTAIGPLAAGAQYEASLTATLPSRAIPYPWQAYEADFRLCIVPSDRSGSFLDFPPACVHEEVIEYLTDYSDCALTIVPAVRADLTAPNCGDDLDTIRLLYVFAFDAEPDRTYTVTGSNHSLLDADGRRVSSMSGGGRHYIVSSPAGGTAWVEVQEE